MENTSSTWLLKAAARGSLTISKAATAAKMESRTQESSLDVDASLQNGQNGLLVMLHLEEASRNEFANGESSKCPRSFTDNNPFRFRLFFY